MDRDPSEPIAEELPKRCRPILKLREKDKFEGFRESNHEDDWVPEPPTY